MAKGKIAPVMVSCKVCGTAFEKRPRGPSTYCGEKCRHSVELAAYHVKRRASGLPHVGEKIACARCGTEVEREGPAHKYCSVCAETAQKERFLRYRMRHSEKLREKQRIFDKERQKQPARKEASRRYGRNRQERNKDCPRWKLDRRMSTAVLLALRDQKGGRKWEDLVGYSLSDLASHLERRFTKGMTWDNMGRWHIDHIRPKASFTYTSPDDPQFLECWALPNLRPLWAKDNLQKNAKRVFLL